MKFISLGCNCFWGEIVNHLNNYCNNIDFNNLTNFFSYGGVEAITDKTTNIKYKISKCDMLYELYTNILKNNSNTWITPDNIKNCIDINRMTDFYFSKNKQIYFRRHSFKFTHNLDHINIIKLSMQFFKNKADVYIYGGNILLNNKTLELILYINYLILQINPEAKFFIFSTLFFNRQIAKNIFFIKIDLTNCMFKTGLKPYRLDIKTYLTLCKVFNFQFPSSVF